MLEEYYVTSDTLLLISLGKNKTKIYDINGNIVIKKTPFEIIEESCQYYGSSYSGRYVGAKKILDMDYKLPIIMDEVKEVVMFPTCSPKLDECCWVCVNNIENYKKYKQNSIIKFTNGTIYEMNISFNSLENQIMRATMLLMKLKKRKSSTSK